MSRRPTRPAALSGRLFRGSEQVGAGLLTPAALRSSAWRRLFPDVYACATLADTHERRARAAAGLLVPDAVVSGRSAAVLWGVDDMAAAGDDVELTVDATCRAGTVRGLRVTRRSLSDVEVTRRRGVRVTTPLRTALDLSRIAPLDEAVVCLDRFLQAGWTTLPEVVSAADALTGPGCRSIRRAVGLADGLAESPQETRVRLLLHRSSLPHPVAQYEVRDRGRFVARVDFAWPELRVAVEYDGAWHGQNVVRDRRRLNELTAVNWTVVFVTAADLADPVVMIARIGAALAARRYA